MKVWNISLSQYRSSIYEKARTLLRSRNRQAQRDQRLAKLNQELNAELQQQADLLKQANQQITLYQQQISEQQNEIQQLRSAPLSLPSDLPLPHHSYGPKMIALCLNLARKIGFRPTVAGLDIVFDWMSIKASIPTAETIRMWAARAGVATLQTPHERADDWIWMADHSNQIGCEKVLQILGIRAADLPPPGKTLAREKMHVLAVVPAAEWKREDVRREYDKLAKRLGPPRFLLTDGAVELRESADVLEKDGEKPILLRDFKHFAANTLEQLIGKSDRFKGFVAQLGQSRSQIQQTELSHFAPLSIKPKARFMNLGPTLRWGQMVSYHLSQPQSPSRQGITAARMTEKLGWVRSYREDLNRWSRCQAVMQTSLKTINEFGLSHITADELTQRLTELRTSWSGTHCPLSESMASKLLAFVTASAAQLKPNERTWLSTENLESSFGAFKQLEGQSSKGGFTSLVAAMPMLLHGWTATMVRESFRRVSVKQTKNWIKENLGQTLTAKRRQAYRIHRKPIGLQIT